MLGKTKLFHTTCNAKQSARCHVVVRHSFSCTSFIIHETHGLELLGNPSSSRTRHSTGFFQPGSPTHLCIYRLATNLSQIEQHTSQETESSAISIQVKWFRLWLFMTLTNSRLLFIYPYRILKTLLNAAL